MPYLGPHPDGCDCIPCENARDECLPTDGSCAECLAPYGADHRDGCSGEGRVGALQSGAEVIRMYDVIWG